MHALAETYLLDLDRAAVDLFVIPNDSLELVERLLRGAGDQDLTASARALRMLLGGLSQVAVYPCTKGRFYDMAERKLVQLVRLRTNEVVTVDFAAMVRHVIDPLPAGARAGGPPV